jgi:multicomponent Na+:H+ antiporter subunit E
MKYLALFIILLLIWLALTFSLRIENIIAGLAASLITTLLFGRYFNFNVRKFLQPRRYLWLFLYLFVFLWECLKANLDVAYRVLHPAMPIKPGIIKVKMNLNSDTAKMMLANSITMTPGTISVDILDDNIYIHWIYVRSLDPEIYSEIVARRFERLIKRIFD